MKNISVVSVNISEKKGTIKKPVPKIVIDSRGIKTDAHAGDWHRQVSLLSQDSIDNFCSESGIKVDFGAFAENITIRGVDLRQATTGDRIILGKVRLEVTQIGKTCHGTGCAIYRQVGKCIMPTEGIFCKVIHGGTIKPGTRGKYIPRSISVRVITLSNRASKSIYEDKSGPAIKMALHEFFRGKQWDLNVINILIPDSSHLLKQEIKKALKEKTDFIFTTGGTGIGPSDITPETITPMLDKTLPGIMEYVRVKTGEINPNALLSRSVAGVIQSTMIFTLPGSVKAVTEYVSEITKIMEHSVFMLKEIDTHR